MWVKTQNGKMILECVGFEIGYHGYGDAKGVGTSIYGITQNGAKEYSRVLLGVYEKEYAKEVFEKIEFMVCNKQRFYQMPKERQRNA